MKRALVTAALLGAMLSAAPARAEMRVVAVMPFRNVSGDPGLDWLSLGIAEALISDLRKLKSFRVVERSQIESALAELKLQKGADPAGRAADLGRLLGARVLVLGGYQVAGTTARLTARFVDVESGEVEKAAKVTGPLKGIFSLEDKIVDLLTARYKVKVTRAEKDEVRKVPTKSMDAFRLYSMSLGAGSQDERRAYLKSALAVDPKFVYALDDLKALEKRMEGYREARDKSVDAEAAKLRKEVLSADPQQSVQAAMQLLSSRMQTQKYKKLLEESQLLYDKPPQGGPPQLNIKEFASFCIVLSHSSLKHADQALQAGERHLKEFPGGAYFASVESTMSQLIEARRRREEGLKEMADELQKNERERAEVIARGGPAQDLRLRSLDLQPCVLAQRHQQYARALKACEAFRKAHPLPPPGSAGDQLASLTYFIQIQSLTELGRFDDARTLAAELLKQDPESARRYSLKTLMQFWPRD